MSNTEENPFNRSSIMRRSPPPTPSRVPDPPPTTTSAPAPSPRMPTAVELAPTAEIQRWLSSIESYLNDVCTIAGEGKLNSDQKLKINALCRKVGHGVSQMAVQYQAVKHRYLQAHSTLEGLQEKQDVLDSLNDIKVSLNKSQKSYDQQKPNVSFADMVKRGPDNFVRPNTMNKIAIYPSDKSKSSDETQKMIQSIISPEEMQLQIRGVRKVRNGGVIISTDRKEDIEKLKQSEKLNSSGLKVEEPSKRRPRIVLVGVPSSLNENQVLEYIYDQNIANKLPNVSSDNFMSSIKLSHKSGKKDASTCNYILEVSAEIRKFLINQERVYINWTSCPVRDFTIVTRCYSCQQYGHAAKFCREPKMTCSHCSELGHSIKECTKKEQSAVCATCHRFNKPSNHKTGDVLCPAKKIAEERYINSIDYVGA